MRRKNFIVAVCLFFCCSVNAQQLILPGDYPDPSVVKIGDTYWASATTSNWGPVYPILKSKDLVNWKLVNYVYDTLADVDALKLNNGKSTYGRGSWASSIRFNKGTFYVSTFAQTAGTCIDHDNKFVGAFHFYT